MGSITPTLWFAQDAEAAASRWIEILGGRMVEVMRGPDGQAILVQVELRGQRLDLLQGGPVFTLDESFSLSVACEDAAEVDRLWDALAADGGTHGQCGWLKDRWGVSWQVVPDGLGEVLGDPDPARAGAAHAAMMQMSKLDLDAMRAAADAAT